MTKERVLRLKKVFFHWIWIASFILSWKEEAAWWKLPTYPSPKPTLTLTSHLGQNVGLGERKNQFSAFFRQVPKQLGEHWHFLESCRCLEIRVRPYVFKHKNVVFLKIITCLLLSRPLKTKDIPRVFCLTRRILSQ